MGRHKTRQRSHLSSESSDSAIIEEIWPILEAKLNEWVTTTLPSLVKELSISAIDKYISSPEFTQSLSDSLQFDCNKLKDSIEAVEGKISELESSMKPVLQNSLKTAPGQITSIEDNNTKLLARIDDLEQYTRRTNVRIYGIPESNSSEPEDTDSLAINFFAEELGISISVMDISRSHRIGKRSVNPRPIIVRFVRHNTKVDVLRNKRQLKTKKRPFNVQEDLTLPRRNILNYLRNEIPEGIIGKVWTNDGVICLRPLSHTSTIERCTTLAKCQEIIAKYS